MKINLPYQRKVRIEMLPLIDIVFLLLVVFIYAMLSMAVHKGLPVSLPFSETIASDNKLTLAVTVRDLSEGNEAIFINKNPVALGELSQALRDVAGEEERAGKGAPGVLLFADNTISYQQLFHILDKIRQAGLDTISLQAENESR